MPFPPDATDIVFDDSRPYLELHCTCRDVDATLDFFRKEMAAIGWTAAQSAADAAARWPDAELDRDDRERRARLLHP